MNTVQRLNALRSFMMENQITLSLIVNPDNQYYISGYKALIYSRPIVLLVQPNVTSLIVPGLEEEHANAKADVDEINVYYEHPEKADKGKTHLELLDNILSRYPKGTKIGIEFYATPAALARHLEVLGFELCDIGQKIVEMKYVKDEQEIDLIIKAGELVSLALSASVKHACRGISEIDLDRFGDNALLTEAGIKYTDSVLDILVLSPSGVLRTNMPHVSSSTKKLQQNEGVIHSRQVGLNGYRAECERTLFIGEPSSKQKEAFKIVTEANLAAMECIRPGIEAGEVDAKAREIIRKAGYGEYAIHRTGHGIGLGLHEEPYLRFDNRLILQEGMVFSIEPGIYIPELGGFRHSNTVILTNNGAQLVTEFSLELEDLIF